MALPVLAAIGLVVAAYLLLEKQSGLVPPCGPLQGCETVTTSAYSEVAGIPIALLGVIYSGLALVLGLAWWWSADRRALLGAYGLGLVGVVVEAYLVFVQLAVLHAVCVWCVAYGSTIVLGWLAAAVQLRRPA